jgi:16S rRNA (cytidine1402-2'-O)-methyltransferase
MVFYEAPHRILECVDDLAHALGADRTVVLARELTKLFETVQVCALGDARGWLEADADRQRGEFVLAVSGAERSVDDRMAEGERVLGLLRQELPVKSAVRLAVEITGAARNALYDAALKEPKPPQRTQRTQRKNAERRSK